MSFKQVTNLYDYFNHEWTKMARIDADTTSVGNFSMLEDDIEKELVQLLKQFQQEYLDELHSSKRSIEQQRRLKLGQAFNEFIRSQTNTKASLLSSTFSKMVLPLFLDPSTSIWTLLGQWEHNGWISPIDLSIEKDVCPHTARDAYIMYFAQGCTLLPTKTDYLNKKMQVQYVTFVSSLLELSQFSTLVPTQKTSDALAQSVWDLEAQLSEIQYSPSDCRDDQLMYNKYFFKNHNDIKWTPKTQQQFPFEENFTVTNQPLTPPPLQKKHLQAFVRGMGYAPGLDNQDAIVCAQTLYFQQLAHVLEHPKVERITQLALLWVYMLVSASDAMPYVIRDHIFQFMSVKLYGVEKQQPMEERAYRWVRSLLGESLADHWIHATPEREAQLAHTKKELKRLHVRVIDTFRKRLLASTWMQDLESKKAALKKLDTLTLKCGAPEHPDFHDELKIYSNDLLHTELDAARHFHNKQFARLSATKIDTSHWGMLACTVNACYEPTFNEIEIPFGIAQSRRIFQKDWVDPHTGKKGVWTKVSFLDLSHNKSIYSPSNLGSFSSVWGHELTHGFDDSGSQYDFNGHLVRRLGWMTVGTGELKQVGDSKIWKEDHGDVGRFQEKKLELERQINSFAIANTSKHMQGALVTGEATADLGGLSIAYDIFKWTIRNELSAKVRQQKALQFLKAWARLWRCKMRPKAMERRLDTDPHACSPFRVAAILNLLGFCEDVLQVSKGDPLFKCVKDRLIIW